MQRKGEKTQGKVVAYYEIHGKFIDQDTETSAEKITQNDAFALGCAYF
jgi:hypothetical protein